MKLWKVISHNVNNFFARTLRVSSTPSSGRRPSKRVFSCDGEKGRWRDGEMERRGDGAMGRRGEGEMGEGEVLISVELHMFVHCRANANPRSGVPIKRITENVSQVW